MQNLSANLLLPNALAARIVHDAEKVFGMQKSHTSECMQTCSALH